MSETQSTNQWYKVDAQGKILGRMAVRVARVLMGKHRPTYQPDRLCGDGVIIVNSDKVAVTGRKLKQKIYTSYSGYPGGLKKRPLEVQMAKDSEVVIRHAVAGMLPKSRLGSRMLKHLHVYRGAEHPSKIKDIQVLEV